MSTCGQIRLATSQKGEVGLHNMYRPPSSSSCELLLFIGQDPYCLDRPLALSIFGQIKLATSQSQRLTCITSIAPPSPCERSVALSGVSSRGRSRSLSLSVQPQAHQGGCKQNPAKDFQKSKLDVFSFNPEVSRVKSFQFEPEKHQSFTN